MFMGRLLLAVLLLTACVTVVPRTATNTRSPAAATPEASPSPSRSPFLAVVGGPKNSSVSLVASDGTVVATTNVDLAPFRMHVLMSWTSASRARLYYLNGGSEVRFLAPGGTTGSVTRIAVGASEQAGFAVSPDDASIAVAIFSYTPLPEGSYKGMRLYVEDLNGGGHHADIFSSTTVAEFPVGWTSGRLVLAVSEPGCCKAQPVNPYDATSYHVVDPATGTRLASLCNSSQGPEGPIEPIGAICYHPYQAPTYQRWDGSPFDAPAAVPNPTEFLNALSPDGTQVAVGSVGGNMWIYGPRSGGDPLNELGYVWGWLDEEHLVIQRLDTPALFVFEVIASAPTAARRWTIPAIAEISSGGAYLGTFPPAVT
jgi:hypothetical protein